MSRALSFQKLKTIVERQYPARFRQNYIPSMKATREEAPAKSRPARLNSKLLGRKIHVMSEPEKLAALLALYYPNLVDLHEQKVMWPWPENHPLAGYPGIDTSGLPPVRGTLAVCDRLGYLEFHPSIRIQNPDTHKNEKAPFPFLSDLLLFVDTEDDIRCINWSVKDKPESFFKPPPGKRVACSKHDNEKAIARYVIEEEYYKDINVKTHGVSSSEIDLSLASNLKLLFPFTYYEINLPISRIRQVENAYQAALDFEVPPNEVMANLVYRGICNDFEARCIFFKQIWNRSLRVDLYNPILIDYPQIPERRDVLNEYCEWFEI